MYPKFSFLTEIHRIHEELMSRTDDPSLPDRGSLRRRHVPPGTARRPRGGRRARWLLFWWISGAIGQAGRWLETCAAAVRR
jgi:hypothetical protein